MTALFRISADLCTCVRVHVRERETDTVREEKKKRRAALSVKMMDVAFHRLTIT